jgi:hypothetical protein
VDFPHLREGRVVELCWKYGETRVRSGTGMDEGFAAEAAMTTTRVSCFDLFDTLVHFDPRRAAGGRDRRQDRAVERGPSATTACGRPAVSGGLLRRALGELAGGERLRALDHREVRAPSAWRHAAAPGG